MENAHSDHKKSGLLIFAIVGLVLLATAVGVAYYQSVQEPADNADVEVEFVNADQETEDTVPAPKQKQPHKKAAAEKKDSGSVLDKFKNVDIEVHGAKNPCTQTERMMKQCSD